MNRIFLNCMLAGVIKLISKLILVILFAIFSCRSFKATNNKYNTIDLDSIFINGYEHKRYSYPSVIFFSYRFQNNSNETIQVKIRHHSYEPPLKRIQSFSVYENDTIELFSNQTSAADLLISPGEIFPFEVNMEDEDLYRIYQTKKLVFPRKQDFLRDIATRSVNCFSWGTGISCDKNPRRKISFRNPNDSADVEWK